MAVIIEVKYIPATNSKGSRMKVQVKDINLKNKYKTKFYTYDHSINDNFHEAFSKYCNENGLLDVYYRYSSNEGDIYFPKNSLTEINII